MLVAVHHKFYSTLQNIFYLNVKTCSTLDVNHVLLCSDIIYFSVCGNDHDDHKLC